MIAEVVAGLLVELGACTPARAWLAQAGSWDRAWDECPRYGWNGWLVWRLREREAISDAAFYGLLAKLARDVVDASGVDPAPYHAALDAYTAFIGSAGPERNVRWAEAESTSPRPTPPPTYAASSNTRRRSGAACSRPSPPASEESMHKNRTVRGFTVVELMTAAILLVFVALAGGIATKWCRSFNAGTIRGNAEGYARHYARQFKRWGTPVVACAGRDTDNNGYVSCTIAPAPGGPTEQIECAANVYDESDTSCRDPQMRSVQWPGGGSQ